MSLNNRNNIAIAAGILLLAAVGAAAWIHSSESGPAAAPVAVDVNGQPALTSYATAPPVSGGADGYYPIVHPPAFIRQPEPQPVPPQPVANEYVQGQPVPPQPEANEYVQGQYVGGGGASYRGRPRAHRRGRSKKHSIEIVAGTAAAGAAIGAIAGGGPGAAIGAISGAGAGFTYDRLTHRH